MQMQRILLIDERPPMAQALRRDFTLAGYAVDVASSEAIGMASTLAAR